MGALLARPEPRAERGVCGRFVSSPKAPGFRSVGNLRKALSCPKDYWPGSPTPGGTIESLPVIGERDTPVSLCHLALSAPLERRVGLPSGRGDSQLIQLTEGPLKLNKEFGDAHDERPEHLQ